MREGLQMYLAGGVEWSQLFAGLVQLLPGPPTRVTPTQEELVQPVADLLRDIVKEMLAQAVQHGEVRPELDLEATSRVLHALTSRGR